MHLKSLYRKRNREKVNAYNRFYNKKGVRGSPADNNLLKKFRDRNSLCAKCGIDKDIQICHIKPRNLGGKHLDNLISLCRLHHYSFDKILSVFWKVSSSGHTSPVLKTGS